MNWLRDRSVNVISFLRITHYDDNSLQIVSTFPKQTKQDSKFKTTVELKIPLLGFNNST